MFGGAAVSLDADERKLVEHLRKQPSWKFTFAYWAAAILALVAGAVSVFALALVLTDWPAGPELAAIVGFAGAFTAVAAVFYNRTRWAMVAYRLIRRVDGAQSPDARQQPRT